MTKKDYVAIAAILREHGKGKFKQWKVIHDVALDLANYFEKDNPRFNRQKFFEATNPNKGD